MYYLYAVLPPQTPAFHNGQVALVEQDPSAMKCLETMLKEEKAWGDTDVTLVLTHSVPRHGRVMASYDDLKQMAGV